MISYFIMLVYKFLVLRRCLAYYCHIGYIVMVFNIFFSPSVSKLCSFLKLSCISHLYHYIHHKWNTWQVRWWFLPCAWVHFLFWRLKDVLKHVYNVLMSKCLFWAQLDHPENALLISLISLFKMWTAHINHFIDMKCHILRIFSHLSPVPPHEIWHMDQKEQFHQRHCRMWKAIPDQFCQDLVGRSSHDWHFNRFKY